ncbi:HEAT repeat domain-containing protein [Vulgatibacter incomptus]|uniref:HEAT repeat protein n=1 Tax=Vulgatibacter incomptus TaxID=1391653 RepID=A0A0K1PFD7_9BACT|nr:HEAT repeat domain-containing protein [Vulgatibacter incomptus]AKU91829.1 hypothetical protein AKJ08_2216 [Vulgatibacter incomptus]
MFAFEVAVIATAFWLHAFQALSYGSLRAILIGGVVLAGAIVAGIATGIVAYVAWSSASDARRRSAISAWTERWREALDSGSPAAMVGPLPPAGFEAWLRLREADRPDDGVLAGLGRERGIGEGLLRRLGKKGRAARLGALDDLARARLPDALEPILAASHSTDPAVRHAALRAASRTLARVPGDLAERFSNRFAEALVDADLPPTLIAEVLLLADGAAPAIVASLLHQPGLSKEHLRAALMAARSLSSAPLADAIAGLAKHDEPEVRSAALQALAARVEVTEDCLDSIRESLEDDRPFLRVHATRAAVHLPDSQMFDALWARLGDSSWWVRVAAAETLRSLGAAGNACLERASRTHPDRFAREMAGSVDLQRWKVA